MQFKPTEHKSYSYYFDRVVPATSPFKMTGNNETINTGGSNKNLNINFRYHTEGNDPEKKQTVRRESIKTHLNTDKSCDTHKKYTFSLIANQIRQQKAQENKDCSNTSNKNASRDSIGQAKPEIQKVHDVKEHYGFNHPPKAHQNSNQQKKIHQQLCKEKQTRIQAEKEAISLKTENAELSNRIKLLQKQVQQKEKALRELATQIELSKKDQAEKAIAAVQNTIKNKNKELSISSHILSCHIDDSEHSFDKDAKQWSNSTIIYNYQEEYKQVLTIFEIELNEENYHDRLLSQVQKLFKKVDEMNRSILAYKEKDKENSRLAGHIRRLEVQNVHLANVIPILNKEIINVNESLAHANKEIELIHLSQLNYKYQLSCL